MAKTADTKVVVPRMTHKAECQWVCPNSARQVELTVSDHEPTEEGTEVIGVEAAPSSDEKPLQANAKALPPAFSCVQQILFRESVREIVRQF